MTANPKSNSRSSTIDFTEAPASWNTRYLSPEGFECQLTLRYDTGIELLEKASAAIDYLLDNGCEPVTFPRSNYRPMESKPSGGNGNGKTDNHSDPAWCPIHNLVMRRWDKNGRSWYSHKTENGWCSGK